MRPEHHMAKVKISDWLHKYKAFFEQRKGGMDFHPPVKRDMAEMKHAKKTMTPAEVLEEAKNNAGYSKKLAVNSKVKLLDSLTNRYDETIKANKGYAIEGRLKETLKNLNRQLKTVITGLLTSNEADLKEHGFDYEGLTLYSSRLDRDFHMRGYGYHFAGATGFAPGQERSTGHRVVLEVPYDEIEKFVIQTAEDYGVTPARAKEMVSRIVRVHSFFKYAKPQLSPYEPSHKNYNPNTPIIPPAVVDQGYIDFLRRELRKSHPLPAPRGPAAVGAPAVPAEREQTDAQRYLARFQRREPSGAGQENDTNIRNREKELATKITLGQVTPAEKKEFIEIQRNAARKIIN